MNIAERRVPQDGRCRINYSDRMIDLRMSTMPTRYGEKVVMRILDKSATALGLDGRSLPVLLLGAAVTGVLGVLCIQAILRLTRLREDAAIGIVLSVFFGAGVVAPSPPRQQTMRKCLKRWMEIRLISATSLHWKRIKCV